MTKLSATARAAETKPAADQPGDGAQLDQISRSRLPELTACRSERRRPDQRSRLCAQDAAGADQQTAQNRKPAADQTGSGLFAILYQKSARKRAY